MRKRRKQNTGSTKGVERAKKVDLVSKPTIEIDGRGTLQGFGRQPDESNDSIDRSLSVLRQPSMPSLPDGVTFPRIAILESI